MTEAVLATKSLRKSFGALTVSDDVTLDVMPGEIHAVIGPNGAGKSTLINQICGNLKPDSGQVFLNGKPITNLPVEARAKRGIARSFQVSALAMEDTVLQNAMLGALSASGRRLGFFRPAMSPGAVRDTAMDALARVGLAPAANTPVSELSHGQRRRLEVSVALTLKPDVFVMDEPMAGLGFEGSAEMTGFLSDLRAEAPILLVEHDMDAVFALADRISVLVYGKIIATGTVDDIRANPEVQDAYLGHMA